MKERFRVLRAQKRILNGLLSSLTFEVTGISVLHQLTLWGQLIRPDSRSWETSSFEAYCSLKGPNLRPWHFYIRPWSPLPQGCPLDAKRVLSSGRILFIYFSHLHSLNNLSLTEKCTFQLWSSPRISFRRDQRSMGAKMGVCEILSLLSNQEDIAMYFVFTGRL